MQFLTIFTIILGFLLILSPAFGYTASKFVSDYGDDLLEGQKIKVLVKVKGEPESHDPVKRAKEIRYIQSAVLKFCNFAGATNVRSDTWNNEFTAIITTSLAEILEKRKDVISVEVIQAGIQLPPQLKEILDETDIANLPFWIQRTIGWYNEGIVSESELINAIKFILGKQSNKFLLASESFTMAENNPTATIRFSDIKGQDAIVFEGYGFRGFHVIDIIISNEDGFKVELDTKTSEGGNLFMPWLLPESLKPGVYKVVFSDRVSSNEIFFKISNNETQKTQLRLNDITTSTFNEGQPIVFSGKLTTLSNEIIPNAQILIKSDGTCPADGIIAKGKTDKYGRYWIYTLTKIWNPSDNLIKAHAEFLGDENYSPSSSQDEVIVVYPIKGEGC